MNDFASAIRIVQIHQTGLRVHAGRSKTGGMIRIPLHFGRAPRMAFDNHAFRDPVHRRCRRVILRPARHHVFRRIDIGHDALFRLPRAPGKSGESHRTGHQ